MGQLFALVLAGHPAFDLAVARIEDDRIVDRVMAARGDGGRRDYQQRLPQPR